MLWAISYRFNVMKDGTFENRKTFAFIDTNIPDGTIPCPESLAINSCLRSPS